MPWQPDARGIPILTGQSLVSDTPGYSSAMADALANIMPVGVIQPYAGDSASLASGWKICDGSELERSEFPLLWSALGGAASPYGATATSFNLPDFRNRTLMGASTSASPGGGVSSTGKPAGGVNLTARPAGTYGGDERMHHHSHGGATHAGGDHYHTGATGGVTSNHYHGVHAAPFVTHVAGFGPHYGTSIGVWTDGQVGTPAHRGNHGHSTDWFSHDHAHHFTTSWSSHGHHAHGLTAEGNGTQGNMPPYLSVHFIILAKY